MTDCTKTARGALGVNIVAVLWAKYQIQANPASKKTIAGLKKVKDLRELLVTSMDYAMQIAENDIEQRF